MSGDTKFHGGRPVYDNNRHSKSVRYHHHEWDVVKAAAARTPESVLGKHAQYGSWYNDSPSQPLTWVRAVSLDWAGYVKELPATVKPVLPAQTLKLLQARNAHLEKLLREAGIDPDATEESEAKPGRGKRGAPAREVTGGVVTFVHRSRSRR
jgi:hypothetical protein